MKRKPQSGLSEPAQSCYERITAKYTLSADGLLVLRAALESFDDYVAARAVVQRVGIIGRDGKKNPAADVQASNYKNFLAGFRYLGLDADPEELGELATKKS
jgi:hypothetical protein